MISPTDVFFFGLPAVHLRTPGGYGCAVSPVTVESASDRPADVDCPDCIAAIPR